MLSGILAAFLCLALFIGAVVLAFSFAAGPAIVSR